MPSRKFFSTPMMLITASVLATALCTDAQEKVVYSFPSNGVEGWHPNPGLVVDSSGNIYGTTLEGGGAGCAGYGCGTVFELSPRAGGGWSEKLVRAFSANGNDGYSPGSGLAIDSKGDLYGTTGGGSTNGQGAVFELMPERTGAWSEKVLFSFENDDPEGLTLDGSGKLYGMTYEGGTYDYGTVFELTAGSGGRWREGTIFNFDGTNGQNPLSTPMFDSAGNMYGTTIYGGEYFQGAVFELSPGANGAWGSTVLQSFPDASDAERPNGGLIFDSTGNLYGAAVSGGPEQDGIGGSGTVFKLSPGTDGVWSETTLYTFRFLNNGTDGSGPQGPLVFDSAGNLYGTTGDGGKYNLGTIFKLSPGTGGVWTETKLYDFDGPHGQYPWGGLIFISGKLYGTTSEGGAHNSGVVFEVAP